MMTIEPLTLNSMETKKVQKNLIPVYSEKKKNTIETD
jgi:hypothetical protein